MANAFTIYHGGEIVTMEGDDPSYVECLVVSNPDDGGKIIYAGTIGGLNKTISSDGYWFDLKGACVFPGFIDPHIHPSMAAVLLTTNFITPFDWSLPDRPKVIGVRTERDYHKGNPIYRPIPNGALKELVRSKNKENSDSSNWIITWGYHHLFHGNMSRRLLDEICPDQPLIIWHRSFHEVYLNSKAFEMMEFENQEEIKAHSQVEWDNGHFFEKGMELLMKSSTFFFEFLPKLEDGYRSLIAAVEAGGITSIADLEFPMFNEELELSMANKKLNVSEDGPLFTTFAVPSSRTYLTKNGSHSSAIVDIRKTSEEVENGFIQAYVHVNAENFKIFKY